MGHTNTTKHKIVLKDLDIPPFKEYFHRIPPPQLHKVREHLKLMLDTGVIRPSNSPWCNAVVLVRKKDGSLHFCIDFRKLNSLTVKDSHLLPHICETLESLTGPAHYLTFDMNSGFWQVPMDKESKQYTAFTLGSMGLYECESMPFGLCNTPPTFKRLMQNCLGELNLTYCLIYLDDVIVFSKMPEEHLQRMRVVFDCLREHGLKLKPSKCDVFKSEINYLAHHVSQKRVLPLKKNLESIAQCPPPDTYTKVKSFVGLVGNYRCFINVLVLQEHFSKYVVAYVVKDQTAHTATETLRNGYFRLFGAPAYLVSDQGKAFTSHVITHLCELYGVQKLRTSPYHAQTNGQVERMNQTIIHMIGKLEEDKKAYWSKHLPELLLAYNVTCSAVTGYSPYYLLFRRRPRIPVDYLFPTLHDSPHQTRMEVSVVAMQKRLKEAFTVARHLTSEEVARQCRYYDRKAGAVALQPGDVVMVCTDDFVGKWKVKDQWEDGGFIVESQLEDWPVYKFKFPTSDDRQKPKYQILHRNCLLLVTNEDASGIPGQAQAKVTPIVLNATLEPFSAGTSSLEKLRPSLVTQ